MSSSCDFALMADTKLGPVDSRVASSAETRWFGVWTRLADPLLAAPPAALGAAAAGGGGGGQGAEGPEGSAAVRAAAAGAASRWAGMGPALAAAAETEAGGAEGTGTSFPARALSAGAGNESSSLTYAMNFSDPETHNMMAHRGFQEPVEWA